MSFDPRVKVIELLRWIKEQGLWPRVVTPDSLWVVPVANVIKRYKDLQPHQKEMALWLPSGKELSYQLARRGYKGLEFDEKDGIHFVKLGRKQPQTVKSFFGAGVGKTEALLSVMNQMRKEVEKVA